MAFPIVAIGASAGGLEAVSELLAAVPSQSDMAYVLVQHLDPKHKSLLAELLGKTTTMPVTQIQDGLAIEPAHVYVIPPNTTVTVKENRFSLSPRPEGIVRHLPIDALFTSLAEERANSAVGVVLSGGDSDGSLGVRAIKNSGGITFAQDPASARFPSMPKNAIETGCVDFVLPPTDIAHELMNLSGQSYLRANVAKIRDESPDESSAASEEEQLRRVFRRLRSIHGVDFSHYKRSTLRRRLERRMALRKVRDLSDYVDLLQGDPVETAALYQDFLIRVTEFFRHPESFDGLRSHVFPRLHEGNSKSPIRIWVPGCASGEEVYSIAMALMEYQGDRPSPAGVQIFGTDVSETDIEKARSASYHEDAIQALSGERLKRFFVKEGNRYRVAKGIRDLCIFARQDVMRDPPFSRIDLVSCRNVMIYLDASAQRRVMQIFHYSLRPTGFLMLGPSESVGSADLFELIDKHSRLYLRKAGAPGVTFARVGALVTPRSSEPADEKAATFPDVDSAQREADRLLLARYCPASLLVDEALNVLQFRGNTSLYLEHASGPPSLNLQRIVRTELLVEISPAIAETRKSGSVTRREGLRVNDRTVALEITPLNTMDRERCYLIVFEDSLSHMESRSERQAMLNALPATEKDRLLAQLEREVASMREYLQATMEEQEAVIEELKSAQEEVQSANEEFQSTNEELETAKEELQSSNEELTITNDELRNSNNELHMTNCELVKAREFYKRALAYADAIVETVREPLIILDEGLKVLRINQAYYHGFNTRREEAEGRLLSEVSEGHWNDPALLERLHTVTQGSIIDGYEIKYDAADAGQRILNVNARRIPGDSEREALILFAIEDVTVIRRSSRELRDVDRRKDEFIAILAHELRGPLAPLSNMLEVIKQAGGDEHLLQQARATMARQLAQMVRLVDDLLDLSRIKQDKLELRLERTDIASVLREAIESARPLCESRKHKVTEKLSPEPLCVEVDPVRLVQVFRNLLTNAYKFTGPGGEITLTTKRQNDEVSVHIKDNGIGIPSDMLSLIFEPFRQVRGDLERARSGLGLGLTLVKRLVEMHGGRIEGYSAGLGHGSEFVVTLPIVDKPADNRVSEKALSNHAIAPRRILVVDDNRDTADSMATLLRLNGHIVQCAYDGYQAIEIAERFSPELILLDIGLPGLSGYDVCLRIREKAWGKTVKMVALTGWGQEEDRRRATAAGFDVHMVKPVYYPDLQKLLGSGGADQVH